MCTHLKPRARLNVATRDIVCYKVMYDYTNKIDYLGLVSTYQTYPYQLGKTEITEDMVAEEGIHGNRVVFYGFHSFVRRRNAVLELIVEEWERLYKYEAVLVKCIIPKGTKYYKGTLNGVKHIPNYVSEAIIPVKIIKRHRSYNA